MIEDDIKALERYTVSETISDYELWGMRWVVEGLESNLCPDEESRIVDLIKCYEDQKETAYRYHDDGGHEYCGCVACDYCLDLQDDILNLVKYVHKKYVEISVQKQLVVLLMLERIPVELVRVVGEFLI